MCLIRDGARSERVRGIASTHLQKGHRRLHLIILIALAEHLGGDFTQCGRRRPALRDGPSAPFLLKYLSHSHCQRGDKQIFSKRDPFVPLVSKIAYRLWVSYLQFVAYFRFFRSSVWRAGQISLIGEKHGCYPLRNNTAAPIRENRDDSDARGKVRGACRVGAIRGNAPRRGGRER